MTTNVENKNTGVRYQPDEKPPLALSSGLGIQLAVLCISGVVLTPAIVVQAAGGAESYLTWAVFGAVLVSGISTVVQAYRIGYIGAGYVLAMGTSGAFIAVCVTAIAEGGPAMLATLVIISSLFQFFACMAAVDVSPNTYPCGVWNRHHVDSGYRHANCVQYADPSPQ